MATGRIDLSTSDRVETRPTAGLWAWTYATFGVGLSFALLYAELSQDLRLFRTLYTIRLAMGLSIVALALYVHRHGSVAALNVWRLTWTFGFLAYAVHFLYGWFGVFGGQAATANQYPAAYGFPKTAHPTIVDLVVQHQGILVLYSNLVVTGLWAFDVLLAWLGERARGFIGKLVAFVHFLAWLHVLISFGIATLLFAKNPVASSLGYTLVAAVGISFLGWLAGRLRTRSGSPGQ
jgi:hypothetical protein